ncbi:hypothetical protein [Leisingera sp. ANG-S5]|uniref:hypothetical protein n=1 Tax=Leisingera sp. ANG-S5 TaxID=1577901 RepID=UPI00057EE275|nr:hypothetical protein [Leisingera sp. ANG-S5]KIC31951.1 hypothetical protein RA25_14490 [Leisingera sp. ANG-S5]
MVNLTSSAATPFFYSAQLTAVTSGASASLGGINPALGVSADELQQEANGLFGSQGRRGPEGLPPAAHGWEKPQVQTAVVKLGGAPASPAPVPPPAPAPEAAAQPGAIAAPAAPEATVALQPAPVPEVEVLPPQEVTQASVASPEASYYEKRIVEMAKALHALASQPWPENSVALILLTGLPEEQVEAPVQPAAEQPQSPPQDIPATVAGTAATAGDDSVELRADVIRQVATGDGADAVALEGRIVQGIHTDRASAQPFEGRGFGYGRRFGRMQGNAFGHQNAPGRGRWQAQFANADSVSIRARHARNISTGGGDDAIAIQAGTLRGVRAGDGNDSIAVAATLVSRIRGGAGNDMISVAAQRALRDWQEGPAPAFNPGAPAAEKMRQALSNYAQVSGGSGDDQITLQVGETLAARGGSGDDRFTLQGGTVALQYSHGDGHDTVELTKGANAVVQLREMGASAYSASRDGDTLTLSFDTGGSITFTNVAQGGAIGVATDPNAPIALLHQPAALNATA